MNNKSASEIAREIILWLVKDTDLSETEGVYRTLSDKIEQAITAERERAEHWKKNHDDQVRRNAMLRERPDLPVYRVPATKEYEKQLEELRQEIERLRGENERFRRFEREQLEAVGGEIGDLARKAMSIWNKGHSPLSESDEYVLFSSICDAFRPVLFNLQAEAKVLWGALRDIAKEITTNYPDNTQIRQQYLSWPDCIVKAKEALSSTPMIKKLVEGGE